MAVQGTVNGSGYGNPYVDSLISGYAWRPGNGENAVVIRVAFAEGEIRSGGGEGVGEAWTQDEQDAFLAVWSSYEAVCNIDFRPIGDYSKANILWYSVDGSVLENEEDLADHGMPDGSKSQQFGRFRWDTPTWENLKPGGAGYDLILHELGHGLGLDHPHLDPPPDAPGHTAFPGVYVDDDTGDHGLNQGIWTVMSYNDGWDNATIDLSSGHAMTPMAFDIAALQAMYGANTSYRTGNDSYHLGPDWETSGTGWSCIWDAGGIDTISAFGADERAVIDLRAATLVAGDPHAGGRPSYYFEETIGGRKAVVAGGFTIANGVVIENAIGGNGDDLLIGNHAHNELTGGRGADLLDGGDGYDTAIYNNTHIGQVQSIDMLNPDAGTLDASGDMFRSIERVLGSGGEDWILGTHGIESLNGREGNDRLWGRHGADVLDGGEGLDLAGYDGPVTVDMLFAYLNTGEAAGDALISIEGIVGSFERDDLRGDGDDNQLLGSGGDDLLRGRGGSDSIEGGQGTDTLWGDQGSDLLDGGSDGDTMYGGLGDDIFVIDDSRDVVIEYAGEGYDTIGVLSDPRGPRFYTLAENSQVERMEADGDGEVHLTGNGLGNEIVGNHGNNVLLGMRGNDTLNGWRGNDYLDGGEGDDVIQVGNRVGYDTYVGGADSDTLAFYHDLDRGLIFDLAAGNMSFGHSRPGKGWITDGVITWSGVENVRGGAGDDTIYGDANANRLEGSAGHDTLEGRDGDDIIDGGLGFDTMRGDAGNDTLLGTYEYSAFGVDVMQGGADSDTADFSNHGRAVWIDLTYAGREVWTRDGGDVDAGTWRQVADLESIENLTGSAASDKLYGSNAANRLDGGAGHDLIEGRGGNDVIVGGLGFDTMQGGAGDDTLVGSYEYSPYGVDVMAGGANTDTADFSDHGHALWIDLMHAGREVRTRDAADLLTGTWREVADLASVENLIGSAGADQIWGNNSANRIEGGAGDDRIEGRGGQDVIAGGAGADRLDGGTGIDTATYAASAAGVTVDLATGAGSGGDAEGDTLLAIEKVIGSAFADRLTGSSRTETLEGGDGDDTLIGNQGADVLDGSIGTDWASYAASTAGVTVDLATGTGYGSDAEGDTLLGIEQLIGSAFGDTLRGGAERGRFLAGDGDDTIVGGAVFDWCEGGNGNDTFIGTGGFMVMFGGDGDDTMTGSLDNTNYFDGGIGNDVMTGGNSSDYMADVVEGNDTIHAGAGADTVVDLYGVSHLYGEKGDDFVTAAGGSGVLDGGDDKDYVTAANGDYALFGGAGEDTLEFAGLGSASYTGGSGADVFTYRVLYGDGQFTVTDFEDGLDHIFLWDNHYNGNVPLESLAIEDSAAGAVISWNGASEMVLAGVSASQLTQADFVV